MADKTISDTKLQDRLAEATIQPHVTRIKAEEEEEELWISGEELYTEGSSDEEEIERELRSRFKVNKNQSCRSSSANPSTARRGHSPVRTEIRAKSENAADIPRHNISESKVLVSKNTPNSMTAFSLAQESSRSNESQGSQTSSITDETTSLTDNTKEFSNLSIASDEKTQANGEISWKFKKGSITPSDLNNAAKEEVNKC